MFMDGALTVEAFAADGSPLARAHLAGVLVRLQHSGVQTFEGLAARVRSHLGAPLDACVVQVCSPLILAVESVL
jgi:hypothetical protein